MMPQGTDKVTGNHGCFDSVYETSAGVTSSKFEKYADAVGELFLSIESEAVRWQILLSYIELVIYNVLVGTDKIKPFLTACVL